jgi:sugar phosphate isomerase/epimerase
MNHPERPLQRRSFLRAGLSLAAAWPLASPGNQVIQAQSDPPQPSPAAPCPTCQTDLTAFLKPSVCLFSKHLGWIKDYDRLAAQTAEIGFDGVDLAVRPGGHVLPEKVERDLPRAAEAIHRAGLKISMITTKITSPREPSARPILKTAALLGIRYYRRDGLPWGKSTNPLERIAELEPDLRGLAALNQEYGMFSGIHNHSGYEVGATLWEIYELVKKLSPEQMGSNFDIAHATVEGGIGGWRSGFRLLAAEKRIRMSAIKDFFWEKQKGSWEVQWCPLGQGMVDFKTFFRYLKEIQFAGPLSMHFEYPNEGHTEAEEQASLIKDMKRDLELLRGYLREAGLA